MTTTCNTNTSCDSGFPGSFEVNGSFVMNEGSTLNLNMCCDDDNQSGSSGTDKFLVSGALNAAGHLILTMNDSTIIDCGLIQDGSGNPVTSALVNSTGELVLTLQDGTQINAGVVFNGTANPVVSAAINANNELVLTLQDDTEINAGQIAVPESKDFIVSDAVMSVGDSVEKVLSKTQTGYDLQAYALKQETENTGISGSLIVQAETPTLDSDATSTEILNPVASGSLFTTAPSEFGSMSIRSSGNRGDNIVQPMTSNNSAEQIASASSIYGNNAYHPWEAFNGTNNDENDCWYHGGTSDDEWLAIEFSEPKTIVGYSLQNRNYSNAVPITDWTLQGSDDGAVWSDLHSVVSESGSEGGPRAIREYEDIGTFTYKHFRLYVREGIAVANWELFAPGTGLLIESSGNYYTASSGTLTPVAAPADVQAVMTTGFSDSGTINAAELAGKIPFNIITTSTDVVTITHYHSQYKSVAVTEIDISSYSQLQSVDFGVSAAQILVKKDNVHYSWSGNEWIPHGTGPNAEGGNVIIPMTTSDIESGQSVTASSLYNSAYGIYKAFNGTAVGANDSWLSLYYPTESSPEWVAIDLGKTKAITGYEVRNQDYGQPYSAKSWDLQGSHNGVDWDVLHTVTDNVDNTPASLRSFLNIGVFAYQHYRLLVTDGNAGSAYVSFADIRLIGKSYDIATDGNTVAELEALTAGDWAKLYPLGLTNIAFSYQSSEDLNGATATVHFNTGGSGTEMGAWLLCDASEVRIRWYDNKVTFTAAEAGTYKLAYQDAV